MWYKYYIMGVADAGIENNVDTEAPVVQENVALEDETTFADGPNGRERPPVAAADPNDYNAVPPSEVLEGKLEPPKSFGRPDTAQRQLDGRPLIKAIATEVSREPIPEDKLDAAEDADPRQIDAESEDRPAETEQTVGRTALDGEAQTTASEEATDTPADTADEVADARQAAEDGTLPKVQPEDDTVSQEAPAEETVETGAVVSADAKAAPEAQAQAEDPEAVGPQTADEPAGVEQPASQPGAVESAEGEPETDARQPDGTEDREADTVDDTGKADDEASQEQESDRRTAVPATPDTTEVDTKEGPADTALDPEHLEPGEVVEGEAVEVEGSQEELRDLLNSLDPDLAKEFERYDKITILEIKGKVAQKVWGPCRKVAGFVTKKLEDGITQRLAVFQNREGRIEVIKSRKATESAYYAAYGRTGLRTVFGETPLVNLWQDASGREEGREISIRQLPRMLDFAFSQTVNDEELDFRTVRTLFVNMFRAWGDSRRARLISRPRRLI
jgi:hypothetical protein